MELEELIEHPEYDLLEFDRSAAGLELWANIEIQTPTGNHYCVGWLYNGKGPIHKKESYDLDHINKAVNDGADLEEIPISELEADLKQCDLEIDVIDMLFSRRLEKYDVSKKI